MTCSQMTTKSRRTPMEAIHPDALSSRCLPLCQPNSRYTECTVRRQVCPCVACCLHRQMGPVNIQHLLAISAEQLPQQSLIRICLARCHQRKELHLITVSTNQNIHTCSRASRDIIYRHAIKRNAIDSWLEGQCTSAAAHLALSSKQLVYWNILQCRYLISTKPKLRQEGACNLCCSLAFRNSTASSTLKDRPPEQSPARLHRQQCSDAHSTCRLTKNCHIRRITTKG